MERQPVKTIPIHEHLRPRLCDTYENDSIFDKFEVVFSGDAENVMTGSYNNNFMIYPTDPAKETEIVLQADKSAFKAKKVGVPTPMNKGANGKKGNTRAGSPGGPGSRMKKETDADQIDFNKKILHMSWHPYEDSIAIAATNNVSGFCAISLSHRCLYTDVVQLNSFLFSPHCKYATGWFIFISGQDVNFGQNMHETKYKTEKRILAAASAVPKFKLPVQVPIFLLPFPTPLLNLAVPSLPRANQTYSLTLHRFNALMMCPFRSFTLQWDLVIS